MSREKPHACHSWQSFSVRSHHALTVPSTCLVPPKQIQPVYKDKQNLDLGFYGLSKSYLKIQNVMKPKRGKGGLIVAAYLREKGPEGTFVQLYSLVKCMNRKIPFWPVWVCAALLGRTKKQQRISIAKSCLFRILQMHCAITLRSSSSKFMSASGHRNIVLVIRMCRLQVAKLTTFRGLELLRSASTPLIFSSLKRNQCTNSNVLANLSMVFKTISKLIVRDHKSS